MNEDSCNENKQDYSLSNLSDAETEESIEGEGLKNSTILDLYNTDIIPWDTISRYLHPCIIRGARLLSQAIHAIRYLVSFLLIPFAVWNAFDVSINRFNRAYYPSFTIDSSLECFYELDVNTISKFPYFRMTHFISGLNISGHMNTQYKNCTFSHFS